MALNIPPQNTFLYKSNWTHALDESLLESIIRLKHEHDMAGTVIPKPFFDIVAAYMAYDLGVTMPWEALYDRLQFLESRYLSFKALVKEDGVRWDEPNNIVVATDDTWTTILKKNQLAGAYYRQAEPTYYQLYNMFGPKEEMQVQENEVIVISDTTVPLVATNPDGPEVVAETSDTVLSPVWLNELKSRRKLFNDDQSNGTRESSNGRQTMPPPPCPLKIQRRPPMPNASPCGSSCASSSPEHDEWDVDALGMQSHKLPNRFVAELEQPLPANCRIENEFGCVASVVSETRGDVHQFARGWFQCARNNALRHEDLLIFKYEGNGLFTMRRYWARTRFPQLLHAEAMEFEPSDEENDGNSARARASVALTTGSYNYLY
ncbi:hypothetical protein SASPL_104868 [Salvia splendens]|uniref:Myb/SANT-like domain-containing protein n=1 Tax=Salvia splendens TaxID=180675 RepID=A0A8X8YI01_SALSN|nr:hypothetical protein SASPL_104868 [Salvia splendens]